MAKRLTTKIPWRTQLLPKSTTPRPTNNLSRRTLFGLTSTHPNNSSTHKNRIHPNPIRREEELQTLLLLSANSRQPLITLWMTTWCPTSTKLTRLITQLLTTESIGEAEGGIAFVQVEMDSPEMTDSDEGFTGLALRYGINAIPTLLAFDRQEPQIETKVSRPEELRSREFLVEWIRTEAARQGAGGAGGTFAKFFGR